MVSKDPLKTKHCETSEVPLKVHVTRCFVVYFDVGVTGDSLELTFSLVGDSTSRQWNILVTQLACTDPWR